MTPNPYSAIVLDASALAAGELSAGIKEKTLRTAVHVGVRWIFCPDPDTQSFVGRALFDLRAWRAIAPLGANDGSEALFAAGVRLRRNRIDLVPVPNTTCYAARIARAAVREGRAGGVAVNADCASSLLTALRFPGVDCIRLGQSFDVSGWRDPSIPAILVARRGVNLFADAGQSHLRGVTGVFHAPASPRALFQLLRAYRPRHPGPLTGLAEAA